MSIESEIQKQRDNMRTELTDLHERKRRPRQPRRKSPVFVAILIIVGTALLMAAMVLLFSFQNKPDRSYKAEATVAKWNEYISLLDSAAKYVGSRRIEIDDALAIRQQLQQMKADIITQIRPQIIADSNYYKQQDTSKPRKP